jgi:hypothetical protein
MQRYLKTTIATAIVALLPATAWSRQHPDLETFDSAPAGIIQPGQVLKLEHFRVETALGTAAAIKPVMPQDELASGLALGAIDNGGPASLQLSFDKPRESITFTVVLPPGDPALESVAVLYGPGEVQRQALTIQHSMAGHRVRLTMSTTTSGSFDRLSLQLQRGAYIDGIEMTSPARADGTVADFDELTSTPLPGVLDQGHYMIQNLSGGAAIAPSSDAATWGQVLTSSADTGNEVIVLYRTWRNTLDITVVPDPSGEPAQIDFLSPGHFETLHTIHVDPKAGPQRLSYTAGAGNSIQGIRWTGGKLRLDDLTLRSE